MSSRNWALLSDIAFAIIAMIVAGTEYLPLRFAFGAPLLLYFPGSMLTALLFPQPSLTMPVRLLLILGLSLAVAVVGGLVLNLTPWGLETSSWTLWLGSTTLVAGAAAMGRHRRHTVMQPEEFRLGLNLRQSLLAGAALVVLVSAIGVARWGALHAPSKPFTQLWATPVAGSNGETIQIGIRNHEHAVEIYQLQVVVGEEIVYGRSALMLGPDQRWQQVVPLPANAPPDAPVEVQLYRADELAHVYRRVVLVRGSGT